MARSGFEVFHVDAPADREEELVAGFWALGSAGSWSEPGGDAGRVRIHAFFPSGSVPDRGALGRTEDLVIEGPEPVPERDWLGEWRRSSAPIAVGRRFLVDPRDPEAGTPPVDPGERILLRLPARTAFGTGSHESTRLAVELLEEAGVRGRRLLDVGTGTGILAFAALKLGARQVVAFDVDPAAALLLPDFQRLNGIRFPVFVGSLSALAFRRHATGATEAPSEGQREGLSGGFDLATVNVVPHEIRSDLPRLAEALRAKGRVLFSGILCSELGAAIAAAAEVGLREHSRRRSGEWAAFVAELAR